MAEIKAKIKIPPFSMSGNAGKNKEEMAILSNILRALKRIEKLLETKQILAAGKTTSIS